MDPSALKKQLRFAVRYAILSRWLLTEKSQVFRGFKADSAGIAGAYMKQEGGTIE